MFVFLEMTWNLRWHPHKTRPFTPLVTRSMLRRRMPFHLAESQVFLDGNKRTGIGAAIVFLAQNIAMGAVPQTTLDALYAAMIAIAQHELDKAGLAALLRRLFGAV